MLFEIWNLKCNNDCSALENKSIKYEDFYSVYFENGSATVQSSKILNRGFAVTAVATEWKLALSLTNGNGTYSITNIIVPDFTGTMYLLTIWYS